MQAHKGDWYDLNRTGFNVDEDDFDFEYFVHAVDMHEHYTVETYDDRGYIHFKNEE